MADVSGVFGKFKSKLGLDHGSQNDSYEEYDAYEEYDEYDDYDDYEDYDDQGYYDDYQNQPSSGYGFGRRGTVSTRSVGGSSLPRLVSREDAQMSTRMGFDSRPYSSSRSSGRTMVDSSLPMQMTPEGSAAVSAAGNRKAEGLDSLFGGSSRTENRTSVSASSAGFTPISTGKRNLQVIKPHKYEDAEGVTRALKLGNVAILVLSNTDNELSKRILDFAFGATSALDGGVEGVAPRTYALTTKNGLTDSERQELSNLGII